MNKVLYRKECKTNSILLLLFLGVLTLYVVMIIAMFNPKLGDSLRMMSAAMPTIFAAFGMADVGTTLLDFVSGYLYGMLLIAFPAIYIIILSNRLVAGYVDNGSMTYLLTGPQKRCHIVRTQAGFLLTSLLAMLLYVMLVILITAWIMFPGELDVMAFLRLNTGMFGLWVMTAGVCFFGSCIFSESRRSLGFGSAFLIYALLLQMVGQMGKKFSWLNYLTPFTLFDMDGLIRGSTSGWFRSGVMYFAGIVFFIAGMRIFEQKDLSI